MKIKKLLLLLLTTIILFGCICENVQNVKFAFNHDLTDNILLRGMPRVTASVINKEYKKCKKSMKYSG